MSWTGLIIPLLKLLASVIVWLNQKKLIQAGEDKVIAATALVIFQETQVGKELREHVDNLENDEALDLWDRMLKNE